MASLNPTVDWNSKKTPEAEDALRRLCDLSHPLWEANPGPPRSGYVYNLDGYEFLVISYSEWVCLGKVKSKFQMLREAFKIWLNS